MFAEPPRTPYDVNFRLFGFPIRIHPLFWLGSALLGAGYLEAGPQFLLIWMLVVLISIIVHELGHAVAFQRFGSDAHIVLWIFGGLAIPYSAVRTWKQQILVSLAGPFAGFLLCGIVYGLHLLTDWGSVRNGPTVWFLYVSLVFVNLVWGLFNLFPVVPLDGGNVSRELCERFHRGRGLQLCLKISVGVAAAVAIYSLLCALDSHGSGFLPPEIPWWARGTFYTALLFALLAGQSYQMLNQIGRGYYYEAPDDRTSWEK